MHEHHFIIIEEEGFNMMQRRGMLVEWDTVSRISIKTNCETVYDIEKKKLKDLLKSISKISVTTDMWKSTNKIEYPALTSHFVDSN